MHNGIMAITAINWKMAIVPSRFEATEASLHQDKNHVIGKHGIEDVPGDIAPQIHAEVLAENFYPQRGA